MQTSDDLGGEGTRQDYGIVCPSKNDEAIDEQLTVTQTTRSSKAQPAQKRSRTLRQKTNGTRWSEHEDATLVSFAGEKTARELAKLLGRTERAVYCRLARLKAAQSSAASAATGGSQQGRLARSKQTKPVSAELVQVRNAVLTQARRLASQGKRSIEDVIASASDGSLQYAKISQLSEADIPRLKAALQRLIEGKA